jgi:hypothetical protein
VRCFEDLRLIALARLLLAFSEVTGGAGRLAFRAFGEVMLRARNVVLLAFPEIAPRSLGCGPLAGGEVAAALRVSHTASLS